MYHISIKKHQHTSTGLCVMGRGWKEEEWGDGGGLLSLFAVSVLPPSFNSPNDVCNPAGLVLGLDQRIP